MVKVELPLLSSVAESAGLAESKEESECKLEDLENITRRYRYLFFSIFIYKFRNLSIRLCCPLFPDLSPVQFARIP